MRIDDRGRALALGAGIVSPARALSALTLLPGDVLAPGNAVRNVLSTLGSLPGVCPDLGDATASVFSAVSVSAWKIGENDAWSLTVSPFSPDPDAPQKIGIPPDGGLPQACGSRFPEFG